MRAETALTSGNPKGVTVLCPPGKKALSGGADVMGAGRDRITITESAPADGGWQARAAELVATRDDWQLRVYAVCAFVAS